MKAVFAKGPSGRWQGLPVIVVCLVFAFYGHKTAAGAQSTGMSADSAGERREARETWQASLAFGRTWLRDQASDEFTDWSFARLPDDVKSTIHSLFAFVFYPAADPHKHWPLFETKDDLVLVVRLMPAATATENDLVEYHWDYEDRPIRAVVSRNAMKIDFDLEFVRDCQGTVGASCVNEVRGWVEEVLKLEGEYPSLKQPVPYQVHLPWPDELTDGIAFSSAPEQNIMRLPGIPRYFDRVDAFVENGTLSILIYRKVGQLMGYQDGSQWFPEDFRAAVLERSRELGKAAGEPVQEPQE
jgi:hypothetical protein